MIIQHRAGAKHIYIPGGSLGVRACSAGEIGGGVRSTYSVQFDGTDDFISLGNPSAINFGSTDSFTIAGWVKRSDDSSFDQWISKDVITGNQKLHLLFFGTTLYRWDAFAGPSVSVADGWTHVAYTFQSSGTNTGTEKFYKNGLETHSRTGSVPAPQTSQDWIIGRSGVNAFHFAGLQDDVRFYNTNLASPDIAALAAGQDIQTNLVAYWPLEEGTGVTAVDTIGGNNGTLTNGPTWSTDVPSVLT